MPQIPKPLREIAATDLQAVCDGAWPEDEQLDFKITIPFKGKPEDDPWRGRQTILDHGRDQLLATVVAFANSYGGDLLVGIEETPGNPGTACSVAPLPNCADAADRLSKQANACIEPHLSGLEVRGIPTDSNGSGVIMLRVASSRNSPHRLTTTKDCYHRVRHETLAMSMRQIQDLTFSTSRGLAAIEERFAKFGTDFHTWGGLRAASQGVKRSALRISCVPLSSCYIENVHGMPNLAPTLNDLMAVVGGNQQVRLNTHIHVDQWRPILRGTGASGGETSDRSRVQLYCDGAITYENVYAIPVAEDTKVNQHGRIHELYSEWFFGTVGNAMRSADAFRNVAGAPAVEYALEAEIAVSHPMPVIRMGDSMWRDKAGEIQPSQPPYPRYVLGPRDTWPQVSALIWRDFWNSIGVTTDKSFEFRW